jgi:hypothetical protein
VLECTAQDDDCTLPESPLVYSSPDIGSSPWTWLSHGAMDLESVSEQSKRAKPLKTRSKKAIPTGIKPLDLAPKFSPIAQNAPVPSNSLSRLQKEGDFLDAYFGPSSLRSGQRRQRRTRTSRKHNDGANTPYFSAFGNNRSPNRTRSVRFARSALPFSIRPFTKGTASEFALEDIRLKSARTNSFAGASVSRKDEPDEESSQFSSSSSDLSQSSSTAHIWMKMPRHLGCSTFASTSCNQVENLLGVVCIAIDDFNRLLNTSSNVNGQYEVSRDATKPPFNRKIHKKLNRHNTYNSDPITGHISSRNKNLESTLGNYQRWISVDASATKMDIDRRTSHTADAVMYGLDGYTAFRSNESLSDSTTPFQGESNWETSNKIPNFSNSNYAKRYGETIWRIDPQAISAAQVGEDPGPLTVPLRGKADPAPMPETLPSIDDPPPIVWRKDPPNISATKLGNDHSVPVSLKALSKKQPRPMSMAESDNEDGVPMPASEVEEVVAPTSGTYLVDEDLVSVSALKFDRKNSISAKSLSESETPQTSSVLSWHSSGQPSYTRTAKGWVRTDVSVGTTENSSKAEEQKGAVPKRRIAGSTFSHFDGRGSVQSKEQNHATIKRVIAGIDVEKFEGRSLKESTARPRDHKLLLGRRPSDLYDSQVKIDLKSRSKSICNTTGSSASASSGPTPRKSDKPVAGQRSSALDHIRDNIGNRSKRDLCIESLPNKNDDGLSDPGSAAIKLDHDEEVHEGTKEEDIRDDKSLETALVFAPSSELSANMLLSETSSHETVSLLEIAQSRDVAPEASRCENEQKIEVHQVGAESIPTFSKALTKKNSTLESRNTKPQSDVIPDHIEKHIDSLIFEVTHHRDISSSQRSETLPKNGDESKAQTFAFGSVREFWSNAMKLRINCTEFSKDKSSDNSYDSFTTIRTSQRSKSEIVLQSRKLSRPPSSYNSQRQQSSKVEDNAPNQDERHSQSTEVLVTPGSVDSDDTDVVDIRRVTQNEESLHKVSTRGSPPSDEADLERSPIDEHTYFSCHGHRQGPFGTALDSEDSEIFGIFNVTRDDGSPLHNPDNDFPQLLEGSGIEELLNVVTNTSTHCENSQFATSFLTADMADPEDSDIMDFLSVISSDGSTHHLSQTDFPHPPAISNHEGLSAAVNIFPTRMEKDGQSPTVFIGKKDDSDSRDFLNVPSRRGSSERDSARVRHLQVAPILGPSTHLKRDGALSRKHRQEGIGPTSAIESDDPFCASRTPSRSLSFSSSRSTFDDTVRGQWSTERHSRTFDNVTTPSQFSGVGDGMEPDNSESIKIEIYTESDLSTNTILDISVD